MLHAPRASSVPLHVPRQVRDRERRRSAGHGEDSRARIGKPGATIADGQVFDGFGQQRHERIAGGAERS